MRHFRKGLQWAVCLAAALSFLTAAGTAIAQQERAERNIPDTLRQQGNFTQLLQLIEACDLEKTLTQRGPFTLFALTDEALNQIGQAQLNQWKQNKDQLKTLLQRHILPGELTSAEIAKQNQVTPLQGGAVNVKTSGLQTGQAQPLRERQRETPVRQAAGRALGQKPIAPDDQIVLMLIPKSDPSGVRIIQLDGQEFQKMESDELIAKLQQARPGQPEQVGVREDEQGLTVMIGAARIVKPNIRATNGIIHAIDKVLTQQNTQ